MDLQESSVVGTSEHLEVRWNGTLLLFQIVSCHWWSHRAENHHGIGYLLCPVLSYTRGNLQFHQCSLCRYTIQYTPNGFHTSKPSVIIVMAGIQAVMPERSDETGRYTDTYLREAFIEAITAEGRHAGTGEIAERVGCDHDTAYKKMLSMEQDGSVESRNVGNTLLWSLT